MSTSTTAAAFSVTAAAGSAFARCRDAAAVSMPLSGGSRKSSPFSRLPPLEATRLRSVATTHAPVLSVRTR